MKLRSYTPLRYPGGKAKIYNYMSKLIKHNYDTLPVYAEPFAGGAGLALKLLLKEDVRRVYINDIDRSIYCFWLSVFEYTEKFIELIEKVPVTIEEWHGQKGIYLTEKEDVLKLGLATLFLNRTNRSGIMNAGPIGGYKQKGNYKIDCRFNKGALVNIIKRLSERKNDVVVLNMDGKEFIKHVDNLYDDVFIYLDPPYVEMGGNLYMNFFTETDHIALRDAVSMLKNKWYITYDKHTLIKRIYSNYPIIEFDLRYTLETKRMAKELAIPSQIEVVSF